MADDVLPANLQTVLEDYDRRADEICNKFAGALSKIQVPSRIYHYTDDRGLKGILETGQLWFTDVFRLNDPSEVSHGIDQALSILESDADKAGDDGRLFRKRFGTPVKRNIQTLAHCFVCCFSEDGDELGQWRAYADDGRGYAIGFDAKVLEEAYAYERTYLEGADHIRATFPVHYDDDALRATQTELVDETLRAVSSPEAAGLNDEMKEAFHLQLSAQLALALYNISMYFKHTGYRNEREYRFLQVFAVGQPVPNLKRRTRPYTLVKYREFDWMSVAAESLVEIVIGPSADKRVAFEFADDCLREYRPGLQPRFKSSENLYRHVGQ